MVRWTGLVLLLGLGCVQGPMISAGPAPSVSPVSATVLPGASPAPGEPLALVAGGLLLAPLVMPMWLDLREDAQLDSKVHVFTEAMAVSLDEQRVYLEQSNDSCASCPAHRACRVLDLGTGALSEPTGCIEVSAGQHRRIAPLGGGWFAVRSDAEGVGYFSLVAWSPDEGARELLQVGTGADGQVEAARDSDKSVLLRSSCPLPEGCGPKPPQGEPRSYRFSEATGLREVR